MHYDLGNPMVTSSPVALILVGFVPRIQTNTCLRCCSVAYCYDNEDVNEALAEVKLSLPTGLLVLGIIDLLPQDQKPSLRPTDLPVSGSVEVTSAGEVSSFKILINGEPAITEFRDNMDVLMRKELLEVVLLPDTPEASQTPKHNQRDMIRALDQLQTEGQVTANGGEARNMEEGFREGCDSKLTVRKWAGGLPCRAGYEDKRCVYVRAVERLRGTFPLAASVCYCYWGDPAHQAIGPSLLETLQRATKGIGSVSSSVSVYKPRGLGHYLCVVDADISMLYRERLARLWGCTSEEFDYKHAIRKAPDYLENPLYLLPDADLPDVDSDGHLLCSGPFDYFHTAEDKVWGIGHRAAQMILSWYRRHGTLRAVPCLNEIEEVLHKVDPQRLEHSPIGSIEILQLITNYTGKQSRLLHVPDAKKVSELGPQLRQHFSAPDAPPVYIGSGGRSCVVAGVDLVPSSYRVRRFLVVDPRYTSGDASGKDLIRKGLLGWKGADYWTNSGQKFVNVLLPST
ncbi:Ufsp2p [Perkinsus chesapeaki]|uniref:Ufsp2p n=1 Tax=Perkinsus chesapeaki TaxID=330153 RepID=A0A7J6MDK8_PERCH|nr:Ufsp2p [Perkinsus chesapeaki]